MSLQEFLQFRTPVEQMAIVTSFLIDVREGKEASPAEWAVALITVTHILHETYDRLGKAEDEIRRLRYELAKAEVTT